MKKYAKVTNEKTKECMVGLGTNIEFFKSMGMTEQDVEEAYNGSWYLKGYAPQKPNTLIISELEKQIEELNTKMLRDIIILNDATATEQEKEQAQTYFNNKLAQKQELVDRINELKNTEE
jgi:hypothetical protein